MKGIPKPPRPIPRPRPRNKKEVKVIEVVECGECILEEWQGRKSGYGGNCGLTFDVDIEDFKGKFPKDCPLKKYDILVRLK